MRAEGKWTILHIRELKVKNGTWFQFALNDDTWGNMENISLHTLHYMMGIFRANQMDAKELSKYITSLVPSTIWKRLRKLGKNRLYLGIKTTRDPDIEHPFPFHAIPWEATFANGKSGETWAVAYSAVRIVDGVAMDTLREPEHIGLFCCEYDPPLAQRDALRAVLESATKRQLSEVREITGRTAAKDFLLLQRQTMFYASCHGEKFTDECGRSAIGLVKPDNGTGEDRYFLKVESGEGRLNCSEQFAVPPPTVFCLDACFSANDQRVPEHVIGRGCNVYIGNVFEAVQDSRKNGTPAVRDIVIKFLTETRGKRKGIGSCVSKGRRNARNANIYNTLIYVSSRLAPDKDAFGFDGEIELPRWFMLGLLAVVSLIVSAAIGQALLFRLLLTHASLLVKLLYDVGIGGILFLIGYYTVPKDA